MPSSSHAGKPGLPAGEGLTRRTFLAAATALPAASLVEPLRANARPGETPWYSTLRRCGQINYNEIDPLTIDPEAWMDYWASLKVNAVMINGGGIVAMYPTSVPYHHRSSYLGTRDVLGEMAAAAKKRGFRVVARMDPTYAYQEALEAHPEWFERNRDGSPRLHGECNWLHRTCMFSTYFSEQMTAIYREINAHYPVDGFYTNGWPSTRGQGICYCATCQKMFREKVEGVPAENAEASSLLLRKYYAAYMDRTLEIWKLWNDTAQEKNPNAVYVGNLGGGIDTVKSVKRLAEVAAWFNADHQARAGVTPVWDCAQQGRVALSVMNGRTSTNITGGYTLGPPTWRHTAKGDAEARIWLSQTTASGMVPWFHWLGGSPEDTRWREQAREFFSWHAANEPHFRNRRSVADVAVLYPQSTIGFYRRASGPAAIKATDYLQGLYFALLEGRFFFDFVHQENLSAETLARYKVLLAPNAAFLRDQECEAIRQYVKSGGSLLATFETSRYNEWGDPRQDFGLADVLGVSVAGDVTGPHANGYMRIEQAHGITEGFEGTKLLPEGEYRVPVRQRESAPLVLTVVPHFPAYPPEMVYPRTPHTQEPAACFREVGQARVAYFGGDLDRTLWVSGAPDFGHVLQNAVRWLRRDTSPAVTVKGDGLVEMFAWETEPGFALHIVNYTNPHTMRGQNRHVYPLGEQRVGFRTGRKIASVRALKAGTALAFHQEGETVTFTVPAVAEYEVIALT